MSTHVPWPTAGQLVALGRYVEEHYPNGAATQLRQETGNGTIITTNTPYFEVHLQDADNTVIYLGVDRDLNVQQLPEDWTQRGHALIKMDATTI